MARINQPPNVTAFLDMLAQSEIGKRLLALSDDGYDCLVGSTPANPLLFDDYSRHPGILNHAMNSTAAGRYQLLYRYYEPYRSLLNLPDFGPESQDAIAIQQIKESHAYGLIVAGQFDAAVAKCNHIWASLPGAGYGQHVNDLAALRDSYLDAGGTVA